MSINKSVFDAAKWLAIFKFISQIFSWCCTIFIARMLSPEDYGLMAMAAILVGFAFKFHELGLGAAIIKEPNITKNELTSIFWFLMMLSSLFTVTCFVLSYSVADYFEDLRIIPITKVISIIFLINGLQIVQYNLLKKELKFKIVGFIEMVSVIFTSIFMLMLAWLGAGVWTLVGGRVFSALTKLILIYFNSTWTPHFYFDFIEAKKFIKFGVIIAAGESGRYIFQKADKFFAGKIWPSSTLGLYTFAMDLAQIPTDKIVTLINQVSFPFLSKFQNEKDKFNKFYLNITKVTATIVFPIFFGCYLVSEEIIIVLLNDKWIPIIFLFKYLCLAQIITSINAVNNFVLIAKGKPFLRLVFYSALAFFMSVSFFFAAPKGLNALLIPWFSTYLIICIIWIGVTLRIIEVNIFCYCQSLFIPAVATIMMSVVVFYSDYLILSFSMPMKLFVKVGVGVIFYALFYFIFDREFLIKFKNLMK